MAVRARRRVSQPGRACMLVRRSLLRRREQWSRSDQSRDDRSARQHAPVTVWGARIFVRAFSSSEAAVGDNDTLVRHRPRCTTNHRQLKFTQVSAHYFGACRSRTGVGWRRSRAGWSRPAVAWGRLAVAPSRPPLADGRLAVAKGRPGAAEGRFDVAEHGLDIVERRFDGADDWPHVEERSFDVADRRLAIAEGRSVIAED
jgi:hypothetical protein